MTTSNITIIKSAKTAGTIIIHSSILSPSSPSWLDIACCSSFMSTSIVSHMICIYIVTHDFTNFNVYFVNGTTCYMRAVKNPMCKFAI